MIRSCSTSQTDKLNAAIGVAKYNAQIALANVGEGTSSPLYKVIFKSHSKERLIIPRLSWVATLPLIDGKRLLFICINTLQDADRYFEFSLNLWANCNKRGIDAIPWDKEHALFLCPSYHTSRDDNHDASPQLCPDVQNNIFAENSRGLRFHTTKSMTIVHFALRSYANLPGGLPSNSNYISGLNDAIGWNYREAAEQAWSYMLFMFRMNVPLVTI